MQKNTTNHITSYNYLKRDSNIIQTSITEGKKRVVADFLQWTETLSNVSTTLWQSSSGNTKWRLPKSGQNIAKKCFCSLL